MHSSISSTDLLPIGRIRGVHGLTGLVKVELYWAQSSALLNAGSVVIELAEGQRRRLVLQRVEPTPRTFLVKFQDVDDRDAAKALAGARLLVDRGMLSPLAPGEIFLIDLIGFEVVAPDGPVGRVTEVMMNPSVDSLIIELLDGRCVEQALAPTWVERLDTHARRVHLFGRAGWID